MTQSCQERKIGHKTQSQEEAQRATSCELSTAKCAEHVTTVLFCVKYTPSFTGSHRMGL